MSHTQIDLASCLVRMRYGPELGHLVKVMGGADFITLAQIRVRVMAYPGPTAVQLKPTEIAQMIGLLVWNKYAEFKNILNKSYYKLSLKEIVRILQYPRYLYHINELFGERGSSMIENILHHGQLDQQKIIRDQLLLEFGNVAEDIKGRYVEEINSVFKDMVGTNFIKREPNLAKRSEDKIHDVPEFETLCDEEKYKVALLLEPEEEPDRKKSRLEEMNMEYWSINGDRFQNYIRDQILVEDAAEMCGTMAGVVLRNALRICEHGSTDATAEYNVSYLEIQNSCREALLVFSNTLTFDMLLALLVTGGYLGKANDGTYSIKMRHVISRTMKNSVLQWIMTRYGAEARKVLHLLQDGDYYEPLTIAKKCLLDEKVAKRVIYRLMADGILQTQDVPRVAANFQAQYSFYLFYADFRSIAKIVQKKLYQAQKNLVQRLSHEYDAIKTELLLKAKIDMLKDRVAEKEENGVVTDDLELKEKDKKKLEMFDNVQEKLLECLRCLELELEINNVFLEHEKNRLIEGYKESQT